MQERMERQQEELAKQIKYETQFEVQDPYQVPISRPVGRPPKRGPGRPPKRGPGRPPKHPRPSNELTEAQLKMLCTARLDVYHYVHVDNARLGHLHAQAQKIAATPATTGLVLLNVSDKVKDQTSPSLIAVPRSSSVQQVEEYVKLKLKTRKSVKLFLQKEDETPLSSQDSLTTLPHTRIFYQIG